MYQQPMAQNYNYYQQPQIRTPQIAGLKGRPVSSLDEVRATSIDFDGSIFYFPNLANDKIYTKQINLDGTSTVKVYDLVELPTPVAQIPQADLVTKEEFTKTVNALLAEISALKQIQPSSPQIIQECGNGQEENSTSFDF